MLKTERLWPGDWYGDGKAFAGRFLQRDLAEAGISYQDEAGRYADFHSLRYTFITSLARAGVSPAHAMRLARHSTIALTMDVYTSLSIDDLRAALTAGCVARPGDRPDSPAST